MKKAIVLGAGVIGLTSAISLLEDGWKVKIIAEKITPNTLSDKVGAVWEPFCADDIRLLKWAKDSLDRFKQIYQTDSLNSGVRPIKGFSYSKQKYELAEWNQLVPHRKLTPSELPHLIFTEGIEKELVLIQMNKFMTWLWKNFYQLGGILQQTRVDDVTQLLDDSFDSKIIIGCCGLESYHLFHDKNVFPVQGYVLKIDPKYLPLKHFYFEEVDGNEQAYIIPRDDVVILGGTAIKYNWNAEIKEEETKKGILERCERLVPGISKAPILEEWIGLRPGRMNGICLESKPLQNKNKQGFIIFNYGHGGSGVTLSFGCAKSVVEIANQIRTSIQSKL